MYFMGCKSRICSTNYVLLCTLWDVSQEYFQQIDLLSCTLWDVSQ